MTKPMTFQEWYTSISIEGDMKHNMGRAWDAALASLQSPAQDPSVWVDRAMTLAQEFASSWSLVGGRFDSGDGLAIAEAAKAELRAFLESTPLPQAAQPICDDCLQRKVCTKEGCRKPVSEQNARFAIDGAITYGRQGINKPPTDDHWLMPFWQIGRQLAAQPKQAAPKILTIGQRVAAVRALQDYVEQALDEYELCGDEGYYTPNKDESLLIHDCVQGLLADQDFIRLVAALALPYVEPTAAPASPSLATERDAVDARRLDWPAELTPELAEVLGWPNFRCAPIAHLFQKAGYEIKTRSEDEQAFVLHWLVTLLLTHGDNWRDKAAEKLRELQDQVAAIAQNEIGK